MKFELSILGSNSAVPAYGRFPTAQILQHHRTKYMIDCGEGAQMQLSKFKIKRGNLKHIFISHLHGDHFFGLVGLLNSLRLNGRKDDLYIYGSPLLYNIIKIQVDIEKEDFGYKIIFEPLEFGDSKLILDDKYLQVFTIPLDHKIDCNGFLFKEKPKPRKINGDAVKKHKVSKEIIEDLRSGKDFINANGEVIKNELLTLPPPPSRSYAYCSDTRYNTDLIPIIKNVDLLYHEATFMEADKEKAYERFHSTGIQAAEIAKNSAVKKLLIGHFSARYQDLNPLLEEAKSVFKNTDLAIEGSSFLIE